MLEKGEILNQYKGAGNEAKRGFVELIFYQTSPPPSELSPEGIDSQTVRVILANQYNLKKGTDLIDERASEAIMNELSEIDGLERYEPQLIKDLTYEDKK